MKNGKRETGSLKKIFYISRLPLFIFRFSKILCLASFILLFGLAVFAQNKFENKPISEVEIAFDGKDSDASAAEQFRLIARTALGENYTTVKVRDAIAALYRTEKIVSTSVVASEAGKVMSMCALSSSVKQKLKK